MKTTKIMNNNKISLLIVFLFILTIPLTIAGNSCNFEETGLTLGSAKQGDCIQLVQTYSNSTYTNLTKIQQPDKSIIFYNPNVAFQKQGRDYNLTYCNTSITGPYEVTACTDVDGIDTCIVYNFCITPSGNISTVADSMTMIWQIVILIIALICFMVMGVIFKIDGIKIFFFVLAGLTLFALVGIALSSAQINLYSYTEYGSVYSSIYILFAIIGGVAIFGLILWLIYFAYNKFAKMRIGDFDED